ncbi:hypothetical protein HJC10_03455 [Corallococcus exiguus]|nr:hypothetical protein [Corallococcus exiguus]
MEPFWEKVLLLLIDKLLLAGAGAAIVFFFSRALERYKRDQAVTLELGKLRAQAFVRILSSLSSIHAIMNHALERRHEPNIPPDQMFIAERLPIEARKLHDAMLDGGGLLDETTRKLLKDYTESFNEFNFKGRTASEISDAELETRRKKIEILRNRLLAYLPSLPKAD